MLLLGLGPVAQTIKLLPAALSWCDSCGVASEVLRPANGYNIEVGAALHTHAGRMHSAEPMCPVIRGSDTVLFPPTHGYASGGDGAAVFAGT